MSDSSETPKAANDETAPEELKTHGATAPTPLDPEAAPEAEEPEPEATEAEEKDPLATLEEERDTLKEQLLRALAEAENVRKRALRDREEAGKYAVTSFARDLLSVADNMARALDALPEDLRGDERVKGLIDGIEMTGRELETVFTKHGIKVVHPEGERFDHNLHQAMFELEHDTHPAGHVAQVLQPGYVIHDRLLRPAMVGVSKGKGEEPERGPES